MTPQRKQEIAWASYSWANHSFSTTILVGFFPIFFAQYWAKGVPGGTSTFYLGAINSAAAFIVMLMAPWLGALADRLAWKKRLLAIFTVIGALASAGLALIGEGQWLQAAIVFAIASIGFYSGSSFQDALLVQVADAHDSDRVSALGYAYGYLGGGVLLVINVVLVMHPAWFGLSDAVTATKIAFVLVGLWWAGFSIPTFRGVVEPAPIATTATWADLWRTLKRVANNVPVRNFLLAYWLYIDALGTVQQMAVDFGAKLGFSTGTLIGALLMVQFLSFPAAIAFGRIAGKIGTRRAIYIGLGVFVLVTCWAYVLRTALQFFLMAVMVALVQGGVQSLSRSFFSRLIPRERAGEYFGFYNMLGKFAAVLGPLTVGVVARITGDPHLSILALIVFFAAGAALLARVRDDNEPAMIRA